MILRSEVVLERASDHVFDVVARRLFETYHLWNTGVIEIRALTAGPVGVGSRGIAVDFVRRGKNRWAEEGCTFEVIRLVDDRELQLEQSDPHFAIERSLVTLLLEPQGGRTLLRLSEDLRWGNDWVGFARPFVFVRRKLELRRNLRRLKSALEGPALPPPPMRPR